ncbi:MAG TPA: TetR/AcrR family transcriptional regulator [Chloroflexota bacterium]|jgi:AcrR family transcriptional regulator|nr:TetR/AcrR family transcriptional regulator [Chloroflexota bacterium]
MALRVAEIDPPRRRPGGRSARVRSAVLGATLALLAERGFDGLELPEVAVRAGVNASTVYRRWGSKARLVGEALLERARPLSPTPDTGALRSDLERLLLEGGALLRTPSVRALFEVLLSESGHSSPEIAQARDRFFAAHLVEAGTVVERAIARSELAPATDPGALIELVIGPALLRSLFMGLDLDPPAVAAIVARAEAALITGSSHRR